MALFFTVNESECALMYKKGKLAAVRGPGRYSTLGGRRYTSFPARCDLIASSGCTAEALKNAEGAELVTVVEVGDRTVALHYVDGNYIGALTAGKHAFFNAVGKHEFRTVDTSSPEVPDDIPPYVFESMPEDSYTEINVYEYQKARICFNGKLHSVLDAGRYFFWNTETNVCTELVDTRLMQCDISGQEMLTRDKVTIRVNFVCSYRITDFVKIDTEIDNYESQLYTAAQLSLREYIGAHTLDEILENKKEMGRAVLADLTAKARELYIDIKAADVKDIILPGEIRDIMNSVLTAEKQAQANVITRREEVASTRSLLNTAKLMEENKTLYKLKELEYVEKICRNVGSINVTGGGDLLTQLTEILRGHRN